MATLTTATSLLLSLVAAATHPAATADDWESLSLPALCATPPAAIAAPSPPDGTHLLFGRRDDDADPLPGPALPLGTLLELVEEDARRAGDPIAVLRPAPPVLVRGSDAARDRVRGAFAELDAAGRARAIEVAVRLTARGAGPSGTDATREYAAALQPGQRGVFGERESAAFLADFEVEVANASFAAAPVVGQALHGDVVELRAWRLEGGQAVFVAGRLDLVELVGIERQSTGEPDLGALDRPTVAKVQLDFSGRVPSDGPLTIEIDGAPLSRPAWTLRVDARTTPDPRGRWRVADTTLLEAERSSAPLPSPGAGLEGRLAPRPSAVLHEALNASTIWAQAEAGLGADGARGPRPLLAYAPGILLAPADIPAWDELDALLAAAEASRTTTREVRVTHGEFTARFPIAEGHDARVLVGHETVRLVDFDVEIASEAYLGAPRLRRVTDGFALQGALVGGAATLDWWVAGSGEADEAGRAETGHGRIELLRRRLRAGSAHARADAGPLEFSIPGLEP